MGRKGLYWALSEAGFTHELLMQHPRGMRYLYTLVEKSLEQEFRSDAEKPYISLSEASERDFGSRIDMVIKVAPMQRDPVYFFYSKAAEIYAEGIKFVLLDYEKGLPLYTCTGKNQYRPLRDTDRLKIYIDEAISSNSLPDSLYEPPSWAERIYVSTKEMELWEVIVGDTSASAEPDASEEEHAAAERISQLRLEVRRTAFRLYIYGKDSNQRDGNTKEKVLATRERTSLLAIIAALASEADIDIKSPSKSAQTIENITQRLGSRVAARTIEEHLKRVPDALERLSKES